MDRESSAAVRFRKHVRAERERRGWSQAKLAQLLQDKGLSDIVPSMIAKVEAGKRGVRVDEANALAELFETSVDALLGRAPIDDGSNLATELRLARHTATKTQLTCQEAQISLMAAVTALRSVSGWQPEEDVGVLMFACKEAANALGGIDRLLGAALAEAGG